MHGVRGGAYFSDGLLLLLHNPPKGDRREVVPSVRSLKLGGLCPKQVGFGVPLLRWFRDQNLAPNFALYSNARNMCGGFVYRFSVPNLAMESNAKIYAAVSCPHFRYPNLVLDSILTPKLGNFEENVSVSPPSK